MDKGSRTEAKDTGVHALNQVLEAEAQAARVIENARADAAATIAQAHRDAAGIVERGDARMQALHACARRSLKQKRKSIAKAFQAEQAASDIDLTDSEMERLVLRLVRAMTGQAD